MIKCSRLQSELYDANVIVYCTFFFGDEATPTASFRDIAEEQSTANFAYVFDFK